MKWEIAVTTAPRRVPTLLNTLRSLVVDGGFTADSLRIFAEPSSPTEELSARYPGLELHVAAAPQGTWNNWRRALQFLVSRPADLYALCQDDICVRPRLRAYLERDITRPGVYTPYLSGKDAQIRGECVYGHWWRNKTGWEHCGALCYVLTPTAVQYLHQHLPAQVDSNRHVDAYVGKLLKSQNVLPFLMHVPSLVQHLGDGNSTLGYAPNAWLRTGQGFTVEPLEVTSESH